MVSRSRDVVRWRCGGRRKKLISYFGRLGKCLLFPCSTVVFFRNRGIVTLAFGTLTVSTRRTSTASNFSKGMIVSTFPTVNPFCLPASTIQACHWDTLSSSALRWRKKAVSSFGLPVRGRLFRWLRGDVDFWHWKKGWGTHAEHCRCKE